MSLRVSTSPGELRVYVLMASRACLRPMVSCVTTLPGDLHAFMSPGALRARLRRLVNNACLRPLVAYVFDFFPIGALTQPWPPPKRKQAEYPPEARARTGE